MRTKLSRKILSLALTLAMLLTLAPFAATTAYAADIASGTDWTLADNGVLTITSDTGMTDWVTWFKSNYSTANDNVTDAVVGNAVTSVPAYTFLNLSNLASVTFESTSRLVSIGALAFNNTALSTVEIPVSVTSIAAGAFSVAPLTGGFTVAAGNTAYSVSDQGALLETATNTLHTFPFGKTGSYTVESGITKIGDYAFYGTQLTAVTIPAAITNVGTEAFATSTTLKTVTFEGSTPPTGLSANTFQYATYLTHIIVPQGAEVDYKNALGALADKVVEKGSSTVNVSDEAVLIAALAKPYPTTITVGADITLTATAPMNADHILTIPSGKTLTATVNNAISIGTHTLTLNGGGTFVSAVTTGSGHALSGSAGTLNLENITVNLQNSTYGGLSVKTVNIGNDATVNLNSATGSTLINLQSNAYTFNVNSGGAVNIQNFSGTGINNGGGTLHINGGEVSVGAGQGSNWGILNTGGGLLKVTSSGALTGTAGCAIYLSEGSKVEGLSGKFKDRGTDFTASGEVTTGNSTDAPSANGLTEGLYIWDGSVFAKEAITIATHPQDATVTEGSITGSLSVVANASNGNVISYQWQIYKENTWDYDEISGATNSSFIIPANLTAGTYGYACKLSAAGCEDVWTADATVTVNAATPTTPPVISTATGALTGGTVGVAFSATLAASNSPTSWAVSSGSLPTGLTLGNNGVISGTPTAAGTANFSVTATNGDGTSAPVAFSIAIAKGTQTAPTGLGKTDETFAGNNGAITGVTTAMEYKLSSASNYTACAGMSLTGLAPGTYLVRYAETANYNASADATVIIASYNAPLAFADSAVYDIPASTVSIAITGINVSGGASGGTAPYTFSATGLPAGITISAAGVISGTPTAAGAAGTATVAVTDSASATRSITINYGTISAAQPTTYAVTVNSAGTGASGSGSYAQGVTVAINAGTPPAGQQFKNWTASPSVAFANENSASTSFTMPASAVTVTASFEDIPPTVTGVTVSPVSIEVEKGGTQQFGAVVGGANNPPQGVTWSVTGGSGATGISASGLLTVDAGETAATLTVTATSTYDTGKSGAASVTVTAAPPAPVYTITFSASDGTVSPSSAQTGADGKLSALPVPTRSGSYSFDGWFTAESGGTAVTTATVFTQNEIIYARWTYTGSNSSSGSGGSTPATPVTPPASAGATVGDSTISTPAGQAPVKNSDGSSTLPGGGTVTIGNAAGGGVTGGTTGGAPAVTVTAPAGTVVNADGGVTIPANASATVTISPPASESVGATVPGRPPDAAMTVTVPGGTNIDKDGNISVPAGKEAEISLPENKAEISVPGGTQITAGGTVTVGGGTADISLPGGARISVPTGSTIGADGAVRIGSGGATVYISVGVRAGIDESGIDEAVTRNADGSAAIPDTETPLDDAPGSASGLTLKLAANTVVLLDEKTPLGYSVEFDNPYGDVKTGDWFYGDGAFVSAHGLMTGTNAAAFSPNTPMTRAMLVTVLYRLAGEAEELRIESGELRMGDEGAFSDVKQGSWYEAAVNWAAENGIAGGVGEGMFAPGGDITREQAAAIFFNYAKSAGATPGKEPALPGFADMDSVSSWALDGLRYCADAGIISGKPSNLFDPKSGATRAEVAAMLHRFILSMAG